jgi:hypothetical protein
MRLLSLPHLSPVWLLEGLRRSEVNSTTARRRAAGIPDLIQTDILEFRIWFKSIYFCNLRWIRDLEVIIVHRTCMSIMRCFHLWQ